MKTQLPLFAILAVLGMTSPLVAETTPNPVQDCLVAQPTQKLSAACLALRADFRAKVSACMTERRINAERSHAARNTRTSHAYKASHNLCSRDVRNSLMTPTN